MTAAVRWSLLSLRLYLVSMMLILSYHIGELCLRRGGCATAFQFETAFGTIPILDCFRVVGGQIVSIRPYYDPRPVIEGMSRAAGSA